VLLVQYSRPIASAETGDQDEADYVHRIEGVLFAAQRLARPITPDARNRITKIAPEVYSASRTIRLLEQWL